MLERSAASGHDGRKSLALVTAAEVAVGAVEEAVGGDGLARLWNGADEGGQGDDGNEGGDGDHFDGFLGVMKVGNFDV